MECIFCQIIAGKIAGDIVYQDEEIVAFRDSQPQSPEHILVIPKSHIPSIAHLTIEQQGLIGRLVLVAKEIAERVGVSAEGYRLVVNCGANGGQIVSHLHFHLLGGRLLSSQLG